MSIGCAATPGLLWHELVAPRQLPDQLHEDGRVCGAERPHQAGPDGHAHRVRHDPAGIATSRIGK